MGFGEKDDEPSGSINTEFFDQLINYQVFNKDPVQCS